MNLRRYVIAAAAAVAAFLLVWLTGPTRPKSDVPTASRSATVSADTTGNTAAGATTIYAHNLELRKGPDFRIYIRWLRGTMVPVRKGSVPSLDDEESFVFHIDRGLVHVNLGDIELYLNEKFAPQSPLKNIKLSGDGAQIKVSGTMHKLLLPLPVEILGTLSPASNGRIRVQVTKISVLKMPVKGLLGGLKVEMDDIVGSKPATGVEIKDNDLYLNTTELLPPPHIRGQISSIAFKAPDLAVTYGDTDLDDEKELAQWHNFLRLRGGAVGFGKLTMHQADLTLIDASDDAWFDLDLANYRQQLVKGFSRMTPEDGLEMFLPDVGKGLPPGAVSLDTLRDRRKPLPDVQTMK